jgi:ABC-type antimicrobial peptide transport system permease subunit
VRNDANVEGKRTAPSSRVSDSVEVLLLGAVGVVCGAVIGGAIGHLVAPPDPNTFMDFGGTITGAFIGILIGALAVPWLAARSNRAKKSAASRKH